MWIQGTRNKFNLSIEKEKSINACIIFNGEVGNQYNLLNLDKQEVETFGNYERTLAKISVSGEHTTGKIFEFQAQGTNLI